MEGRPLVPPKDGQYITRMELEQTYSAPGSGSKRKREAHESTSHNTNIDIADPDEHTPKRSRSSLRQGDLSGSEDATPAYNRSVKRKRGSRNLSNLNLRHAARKQASPNAESRESRFQEGSLTDKPSQKPPSAFTRVMRTESGNLEQIDVLMSDYHDGMHTPPESIEAAIEREKAMIPSRVAALNAEAVDKQSSGGFFQFGRNFASNFHPVTLWNKLWNDSKEELAREAEEETERKRKAQIKADVEAKYAHMKQSGQFVLKPVGNFGNVARTSEEDSETPRDSGVEIEGLDLAQGKQRVVSDVSRLAPSYTDTIDTSEAEVPESSSKQLAKGLKSRLHFKRPSLQNLKNDLKRVKSEFNLSANRDPSSSLSPIKNDFDSSALKKSSSRVDLKKQNRLSKRVSDLEGKLQQARRELDVALIEASPVPKLSGKHERFAPTGTMKRPKFIPGKLPSLPSERILMAEQMDTAENDNVAALNDESHPRNGFDLSLNEFLSQNEKANRSEGEGEDEDEETVKARAPRPYPARASSLFNLNNTNIEGPLSSGDNQHENTSHLDKASSEAIENMDPNSITNITSESTAAPVQTDGYASLDAKLKALDANVKTARNASKPKKRKSKALDSDKPFKPGKESDDDAEWEQATPKKKRKSAGSKNDSSPPSQGPARGQGASKQSLSLVKKANGLSPSQKSKLAAVAVAPAEESDRDTDMEDEDYSADELAQDQDQTRTSIDSPSLTLEPVYEEEEETSMVPLKDAPSKPTAKATPARYGRNAMRPRSTSPNKRAGSVHPGVEEEMMTRAAMAAQNHPGRRVSRSVSPPPIGYSKTTVVDETVSVIPGKDGVPKLPKGAHGSFESLDHFESTENGEVEVIRRSAAGGNEFQWPDDVF